MKQDDISMMHVFSLIPVRLQTVIRLLLLTHDKVKVLLIITYLAVRTLAFKQFWPGPLRVVSCESRNWNDEILIKQLKNKGG